VGKGALAPCPRVPMMAKDVGTLRFAHLRSQDRSFRLVLFNREPSRDNYGKTFKVDAETLASSRSL
jgi:hypothetical protein